MNKKFTDDPIKTAILVVGIFGSVLVLMSLSWDFLSSKIFPNTTIGVYQKSFWENLVISLHGVFIDLVLVTILILWLDHRRNQRTSNQRFKEELEDYAHLDFDEVKLRKLGHLKRLNINKVESISVQNLVLNRMHIKGLTFKCCKLIGLKLKNGKISASNFSDVNMRSCNFESAELKSTKFSSCILLCSKFISANLRGVSFERCNLERCDFSDADMQSSILKECDVRGVKFIRANLKRANLIGVKNLDVNELAKAENLDYIQVDPDVLETLKTINTEMNFQGKVRP